VDALRGVSFEVVEPAAAVDPARMDVAMFIGLVDGLEPGRPVVVQSSDDLAALGASSTRLDRIAAVTGAALPDPVVIEPDARSFTVVVDGVERRVELPANAVSLDSLASLLNADSSAAFVTSVIAQGPSRHLHVARRESRRPGRLTVRANSALGFPVAAGAASEPIGATLPRAVDAFFRAGGRRAWIVPVGAPEPYLAARAARLSALLRLLAPDAPPEPPASLDEAVAASLWLPPLGRRRDLPDRWHGPAAALGIEEAFLLCLPDLVELTSPLPDAPPGALPPEVGPPEAFVPCVVPSPAGFASHAPGLPPPAVDRSGLLLWRRVVRHLLLWLAAEAPDRMLLLSVPPLLPEPLPRSRGSAVASLLEGLPEGALGLCQLVQPWLTTADGTDLPGGVVPPEAVLAGVLGAHALTSGSFLSAAGTPIAATGLAEALSDPDDRTARFETGADGTLLAADRTPSPDPVARHAAVRRLTALLLRSAARLGAAAVFEPSGQRLWRDIEIRLGLLLERVFAAGGLRGRDARDAFFVRCNRSTMTPADIENGRVIAEVGFAPALPVERIRVRLALDGGLASLPGGAS
jgi:uncharacterized protein